MVVLVTFAGKVIRLQRRLIARCQPLDISQKRETPGGRVGLVSLRSVRLKPPCIR